MAEDAAALATSGTGATVFPEEQRSVSRTHIDSSVDANWWTGRIRKGGGRGAVPDAPWYCWFARVIRSVMKNGVEKTFHSDGKIAGEVTYVNDLPNGITRRWHPNGVLASELPVKDGIVEGVAKQWNDKGELLGSYEVRKGCGVIKTWHSNGKLQGETPMLNGKWTGRQRVWFEDGTLAGDVFWIENQKVSKKKYLAACKENPNLPRYED